MRFRLSIISLCLPAVLLAQQSPSRDDEATIRQLEERWRIAQHANDTAVFRRLLAPDVTFIGTSGSLRDRDGYIASRSGSSIPGREQRGGIGREHLHHDVTVERRLAGPATRGSSRHQ